MEKHHLSSMQEFILWYRQHLAQIKEDYFRFLRFASISADPTYRQDVLDCAEFLKKYLEQGGLKAELIATSGYPIVYAEDLSAGAKAETLLIYGHYDVQPVDPTDLWKSPPFEPTEREGKIFARGAVDDKGQIFYACVAAIAWKNMGRSLPVNLKFCIEGEEESHSMGIIKALPSLKKKLECDSLLIVDFDSMPDGSPAVSLGARGCLGLEVTLTGSNQDLHSGILGGVAYNPNRAMVELLAKLWDENGRVTAAGFYEDVEPIQNDKYAYTLDKDALKRDFGIEAIGGEKGHTLKESNWFRPTLEINGIFGGYTGAGMKTVIPAIATAKISCRLVVHQDPDKVGKAIGSFLEKNAPKGMKVKVTYQGGVGAYRSHPDSPLVKAVMKSASEITGKRAEHILSGGSIPIAADFARVLGVEVVGMGVGLPTDNIHSPNEHFDMLRFEQGFLTVARMLELL